MQTSLPVFRYGRLLSITKGNSNRGLSYSQGERLYRHIEGGYWSKELRSAAQSALPPRSPADAEMPAGSLRRSSAGGFRGVGLSYDFDEFAISVRGIPMLARACVTLCVREEALQKGELPSSSKLWMRFLMPPTAKKPKRAGREPYSLAEISKMLDSDCRKISGRAFETARDLFEKGLRASAEDRSLRVRLREQLNVVSVGLTDPSFSALYGALENGIAFRHELDNGNKSAALLSSMAYWSKGRRADVPLSALSKFVSTEHSVGICMTPQRQRGIYLSRAAPQEANYVLLANSSETTTSVASSPANAVAAALLNSLSAYF